jgi:lysozyme family protein
MTSVEDIIDHVIDEWEGKFSLHPHDRGGATNFGVTQTVYSEYLGRPASVEEVRLMPRAHAVRIYRSRYWDKPGIGRLPEALQAVVFDMAVNMGPKTAIRLLQQSLNGLGRGIAADGVIGKITSIFQCLSQQSHLSSKWNK